MMGPADMDSVERGGQRTWLRARPLLLAELRRRGRLDATGGYVALVAVR